VEWGGFPPFFDREMQVRKRGVERGRALLEPLARVEAGQQVIVISLAPASSHVVPSGLCNNSIAQHIYCAVLPLQYEG
jgi:hypothetical protein